MPRAEEHRSHDKEAHTTRAEERVTKERLVPRAEEHKRTKCEAGKPQ